MKATPITPSSTSATGVTRSHEERVTGRRAGKEAEEDETCMDRREGIRVVPRRQDHAVGEE